VKGGGFLSLQQIWQILRCASGYDLIEKSKKRLRRSKPFDWGAFRRLEPISRQFGYDRGLPIDRYFIEEFLSLHAEDIRGRVLEVSDNYYTVKFGCATVVQSDVLHISKDHSGASIVGDLSTGKGIPSEAFECILLTQTLPFIFDIRSAIHNCFRALKPGGVLLATFPGISQISRYDMDRWGDYWRMTSGSAQLLFEEFFLEDVTVLTYGNVLTAISFLHGLAAEELKKCELDFRDSDYQLLIGVRARKSAKSFDTE
jgi:hypothetical protein